jgi:hypothetical protein
METVYKLSEEDFRRLKRNLDVASQQYNAGRANAPIHFTGKGNRKDCHYHYYGASLTLVEPRIEIPIVHIFSLDKDSQKRTRERLETMFCQPPIKLIPLSSR